MRQCNRCFSEKPIEEFPVRHGDREGELRRECKQCYTKRCNAYKKIHPERQREQNWRNTGIKNADGSQFTHADFDRLYQIQCGSCKICGKHQSELTHRLHTDHNHTTGIVRGLLCGNCNTMIGHAQDQKEILIEGANYLAKN